MRLMLFTMPWARKLTLCQINQNTYTYINSALNLIFTLMSVYSAVRLTARCSFCNMNKRSGDFHDLGLFDPKISEILNKCIKSGYFRLILPTNPANIVHNAVDLKLDIVPKNSKHVYVIARNNLFALEYNCDSLILISL